MSLPIYETAVGAMCPHGDPDCLCDVHITTHTVVNTDTKHMFHELVLEHMDDDWVSARNIHTFLSTVLGCFEYVRNLPTSTVERSWKCEMCGADLPRNDIRRTMCSNRCRLRKSRMKKKGLLQ